jgi:hypothetical protein
MLIFMMRTLFQAIEFDLKRIRLVTILLWGLCLPVHAQTPSFSAPSLPSLPSVPQAPAAKSPTSLALPMVEAPASPGDVKKTAVAPVAPPAAPNPLADLPPPLPESSERITSAPTTATPPPLVLSESAPMAPPPTEVGALPLPLPPVADASNDASRTARHDKSVGKPVLPPPLDFGSNEDKKKPEKPELKSWQTVLAPSVIPPQTNFNYRRQMLPSTISRASYSPDNDHLPPAVMREDYARLLANRAAANDVVATRALLNAGADNRNMALAAAQSTGARDTAQLLLARGARSY